MLPVEILPVQETLVLRARGSELLILPHHVRELKNLKKPRDFSQYFRAEALVNRPARKLFEAWLRKDHTLWPRLYNCVHKEMELSSTDEEKPAAKEKKADKPAKAEKAQEAKAPAQKEAVAAAANPGSEEKPAKKVTKKTASAASVDAKKTTKKVAKKATSTKKAGDGKKTTTKSTSTKKAKKTAKKKG